ncbi:hypothetical protein BC938DRAFT_477859 [Jimgerdemannia flammicorona]|uniref:Alpha-1,3-glucosyltransferase n=1 Tax=Jimgerdemannia flammicorona TaxID=994334 RepID=A0A433QNT0_9FUNG|nr:hypothetical protein BC938DRAFT_477859 [Jimgerdemannia flammicorona]
MLDDRRFRNPENRFPIPPHTCSMFPLLKREKLSLPYFLLSLLWNWAGNFTQDGAPTLVKYLSWVSMRPIFHPYHNASHSANHLVSRPGLSLFFWFNHPSSTTQASYATMAGWHALEHFVSPPSRYPDLYTVANVLLSASGFLAFLAYFNFRQLVEVDEVEEAEVKKRD